MAGVLLIALALARLGRYVRYLPTPVIEGFTAGIAVVIALQQVPAALGRRRRARGEGVGGGGRRRGVASPQTRIRRRRWWRWASRR